MIKLSESVFDGEMRLARPRGYFSFCTFPDNCLIFVFFLTIVVNLIKIASFHNIFKTDRFEAISVANYWEILQQTGYIA